MFLSARGCPRRIRWRSRDPSSSPDRHLINRIGLRREGRRVHGWKRIRRRAHVWDPRCCVPPRFHASPMPDTVGSFAREMRPRYIVSRARSHVDVPRDATIGSATRAGSSPSRVSRLPRVASEPQFLHESPALLTKRFR